MAPNLRNIYLIDSRFQLKYSFYVCVLIFLSSIIYPYTIFELLSYFIDFTAKNIHKLPELKSLNQSLEDKRNNLIIILVLWQLGFTALAFLVNIFLTHKIVGPLFKLKNFFLAIADGKDNGKLYFRNGDYFPDIAVSYNNAMDKLKEIEQNSNIREIRGKGLLIGIDISNSDLAKNHITPEMRNHGINVLAEGRVIMFNPSYLISREQIDYYVNTLNNILTK